MTGLPQAPSFKMLTLASAMSVVCLRCPER